jgi:hypothetical protein
MAWTKRTRAGPVFPQLAAKMLKNARAKHARATNNADMNLRDRAFDQRDIYVFSPKRSLMATKKDSSSL